MANNNKIGVLVGSLRKGSFSKSIANALVELAPEGFDFKLLEIGDLPLYNEDLDEDGAVPAPWQRLRDELDGSDGFLFVTPEYNRSIPAALKNALDVGSRPYGQSKWGGKPGGIVSVTPGSLGGFGANLALRQPTIFLDIILLQQPEAYISRVHTLLDEKGRLIDEPTKEFLKTFMNAYGKFAETIIKGK
jgi:Predicted flavoprotein